MAATAPAAGPAAYDAVADWYAQWATRPVAAVLDAGLVIDRVHEVGDGPAPEVLAIGARKP